MGTLSGEEKRLLKQLRAKAEAPDEPAASKVLNISIDLGDEKQVERASKLGLLGALFSGSDDDDAADDDDDDDDDTDETPKRRGFFPEK